MKRHQWFFIVMLFFATSVSGCGDVDDGATNYENEPVKASISISDAAEIAKKELRRRNINYEGYTIDSFLLDEKIVIIFSDRNSIEIGAHFSVIVMPDGNIFAFMPGE